MDKGSSEDKPKVEGKFSARALEYREEKGQKPDPFLGGLWACRAGRKESPRGSYDGILV